MFCGMNAMVRYLVIILLTFLTHVSLKAQGVLALNNTSFKVQKIPLNFNDKKVFINPEKSPLTLIVFLSPECPLCKNYSLVLNNLYKKFKDTIQIVGVVPGKAYTSNEIQQFVTDYNVSFPTWIDSQKELSFYLKATITPEVVLIDKTGKLIYRGAIDDWVEELGQKKIKAEQHYLENAIIQYLQNKVIQIKQTRPIGCMINEF